MIDDAKIIQDCLTGDIDRYRIIVDKYRDSLMRVAHHFLKSWDGAEDAAQVAFIKAFQSLHSFDESRSFSTWLMRILVNECKDRLKSAGKRRRADLPRILEDSQASQFSDQMASRDLVYQALDRLSFKRRQVLILTDLEGRTKAQTAQILGCAESTVRVTHMKARDQLRKIIIQLI